MLGTVGYMSPEQVRGLPADHRADVFSLGCVLYEMLPGSARSRGTPSPSPRPRSSGTSRLGSLSGLPLASGLQRVVRRCLAKRLEARFPSGRELAFALEEIGSAPQAAPSGGIERAPDRRVLPFADLSAARDQEYFCDGLTDDVFAIQEEIAQSVAGALQVVLTEGDRDALHARRAASLEAYELYLRGRRVLHSLRHLRSALPLFERAIQIDPGFALAHAGLAELSHWLYAWAGGRKEDRERAESASRRALELAPDLAEVHAATRRSGSGRRPWRCGPRTTRSPCSWP